MPIEIFQMERMQSTWENLVDYDMSESGVRPLTLRELVEMGFDLEGFLDQPLGCARPRVTGVSTAVSAAAVRETFAARRSPGQPDRARRAQRGDDLLRVPGILRRERSLR